jgi:hypothetical protein
MAAPFAVENVTDAQQLSQMATLSNGNFVVVYQDDGNFTETDIEYAIFTANSAQDYFSKSGGIKQGQGSGRNLDSQGPQQFTPRPGGHVPGVVPCGSGCNTQRNRGTTPMTT